MYHVYALPLICQSTKVTNMHNPQIYTLCVCITFLVNLLVEFENGEKRSVDLKKVEPEGDGFNEPQPGDDICCSVGGARYSAVILECVRDKVHLYYSGYIELLSFCVFSHDKGGRVYCDGD